MKLAGNTVPVVFKSAPVAQLDRAPDYESGGQEFESLRVRHLIFSYQIFSIFIVVYLSYRT